MSQFNTNHFFFILGVPLNLPLVFQPLSHLLEHFVFACQKVKLCSIVGTIIQIWKH